MERGAAANGLEPKSGALVRTSSPSPRGAALNTVAGPNQPAPGFTLKGFACRCLCKMRWSRPALEL